MEIQRAIEASIKANVNWAFSHSRRAIAEVIYPMCHADYHPPTMYCKRTQEAHRALRNYFR